MLFFLVLFDELGVPLALLPHRPQRPARGCSVRRLGEEVDGRVCRSAEYLSIIYRRGAARRPALLNPSSPNTESLNQGPAVFSTRLMYHKKSGLSAKPPGTGTHFASGSSRKMKCSGIGRIQSWELESKSLHLSKAVTRI